MNSILPNTTLCAIVRDEIMNPAGGIKRFVESHVPFVEKAVIVDTGSKDGTREELDKLQREYDNLRVYDEEFVDFSDARNKSLAKVDTLWTLVLDADELLTQKNFKIARETITNNPKNLGYNFIFRNIVVDCGNYEGIGHNPRLFSMILKPFYAAPFLRCGEQLFSYDFSSPKRLLDDTVENIPGAVQDLSATILHFIPAFTDRCHKRIEFYEGQDFPRGKYPQPCELPSFHKWKALNPRREEYR